jgi:uncharacterized protein (TIGR03083 family)
VDYLRHLRDELDAFGDCLDGDLTVPVEHCGEWTLYDLANHLGGGNLWAAAGVTEQRGDHRPEPAPRDPADLRKWFADTADTLLTVLAADPAGPAWTFYPPHTVGFWRRRRCMETLIHRWDAENALGTPRPIDAALASDGVAEVFDTMAPRQIDSGRARPPEYALRLTATDTGGSWTYGPGAPVATLSGPVVRLLLLLWGRLSEGEFTWEGDREAGQRILAGPLTA